MINMDMVGRLTGRTLVVGGTGTSPGLSELAQGICDELGLKMIDDPPGRAPSDNASFYGAGIPVLFLFTGIHADYHRPGDDHHKLNERGAADIGELARRLLLDLDARDERPEFTAAPGDAFMFRPTLYTGAVFGESALDALHPVEVAVLIPDTPAAEGGLREGDLIVSLDGQPVEDLASLERRLSVIDPDVPPLSFEVLRPAGDSPFDVPGLEARTIVVQPVIR
jgi:membrane-associated protease RseP (regulator of RpoE activity)